MKLKELIMACGKNFRKLTLHSENEKHPGLIWQATPNRHYSPYKKSCRGKTPEEAVKLLLKSLS